VPSFHLGVGRSFLPGGSSSLCSLAHTITTPLKMRSLVHTSVHESRTIRRSEIPRTTTANTVAEQSFFPVSEFPFSHGMRSGQFEGIAEVAPIQDRPRSFVYPYSTVWANTSVEPTATSHTLRHMISDCSITPSRLLLPHPARRRSISELSAVFSQVAVAHLFR